MTSPLLRFVIELQLGGVWTDITTSVRHQNITITRGTRDGSPKPNPAKATLKLNNTGDQFNPSNPTGPYFGLLKRNTPIRISCASTVINPERFTGEVYAFEPRWNETLSDRWVDIEAAGALRRIINRKRVARSYYRTWLNTRTTTPIPRYFWPLEEGSAAISAQPDIGGSAGTLKEAFPDGQGWGKAAMTDWLADGVALNNLNEMYFPCDMRGSTAASWEVSVLLSFDNDKGLSTGIIDCGTVQYFWAMSTDTVTDPDNPTGGLTVYIFKAGELVTFRSIDPDISLPLKDVGPIWMTIRTWQDGTTARTYAAWGAVSASATPTINAMTARTGVAAMEWPRSVSVAAALDLLNRNERGYVGYSCLSVSEAQAGSGGLTTSFSATRGAPAEFTTTRFERLCAEQGINSAMNGLGSTRLGRQYLQPFEDHLAEIVASSGHSAIVEGRADNRLELLGTGVHRGTIDYSEIVPALEPTEDDQLTANIVNLDNSHDTEITLTKPTGAMSVADIGPFDTKMATNNSISAQAVSLAGLRLALGTWEGPRFSEVTVSARSQPAEYSKYRLINVGDFFTLTGLEPVGYHDTLIVKVTGTREVLSHVDHRFTFTVRPGELDYRLWTVGTNRVDLASSTVAVGGSGGSITVNVPGAPWSTTAVPYDVMVAGERMTVTAAAAPVGGTQVLTVTRAVNGVVKSAPVGAAVHAYPSFFIKAV